MTAADDGKKVDLPLVGLSFHMFKPTKLVCAVEDIINIVHPVDAANEGRCLLLSDIIKSTRIALGDTPA